MKTKFFSFELKIFIICYIFTCISCVDGNEWETDYSYDRLFGVNSSTISVVPNYNQAEITWEKSPEAEYYVIEISTDSLYDEIPIGKENALIFGEDKTITASPYILSNLKMNTKYFLRIKSHSSQKKESNWSYYTDYSFTTSTN